MPLRSRRPRARLAALLPLAALAPLAGCGGAARAPATPEPRADACVVPAGTAPAADTVTVAAGAGDAARIVDAHLRETLVRLDCEGRLRPGLAERWRREGDAGVWVFELREGVAAEETGIGLAFRRGTPLPWGRIAAVEPRGDELRVRLAPPAESLPADFANPSLGAAGPWSDRVVRLHAANVAAPLAAYVHLAPRASGADAPVLVVATLRPGADPRDLLDHRPAPGSPVHAPDVLVTRDPATVAYARERRDLRVVPLPFDRVLALATPPDAAPLLPGVDSTLREELARDAVGGAARAANATYWWTAGPCAAGAPAPRPSGSRILHPAGDAAARRLAERVAAIAAASGRRLTVAAIDPSRDDAAAGAAAIVVSLPILPPVLCPPAQLGPAGPRIVPLVETRAHAILRASAPALEVDGHGTIRVLAPEAPRP
jgi:hypothetical protein